MRVAVIGCGAMGAATGWRLAARGVEVVCFDRHSPPHSLGSSHGESRITRTAYFEGAWYVPLLQETFPLWRELEQATGAGLLTLTGALMLGDRAADAVQGAEASAATCGLDVQVLGAAELGERYPGHVVGDGDAAVLDRQAGFLRPEAAVAAMIDRLTDLGGEIRRDVAVSAVSSLGAGVEVVAAGGTETFDAAVIATGPWMPELAAWLPLKVERQVLVWLEIEPGVDWLGPERFPVFIRETSDLGDLYGFPTLDGVSVKLARHHRGAATDPEHLDRGVTDTDLDPVRTFAANYMRGVSGRVTRSAVCMYTNTPDENFAIGLHPDAARVAVVSACSGHGFKFAPVIGEIAADLVCEGGTSRDITRFSLERLLQPD